MVKFKTVNNIELNLVNPLIEPDYDIMYNYKLCLKLG